MFKSLFVVACLVSTLLVMGCAVPMASHEADASAKTFKTDTSKANIYIYRNQTRLAAFVTMPVKIDNVSVGKTADMTYIFRQVNPGMHVITSKADNVTTLSLNTEAVRNYFVWQEIIRGMWGPTSQLHLVEDATGQADITKCNLIQ
jgi:hypothetical protein